MICAVCHRYITKPSALLHGLPVGPVCSVKLNLIKPKPSKLQAARKKWKAFWQAQLDLFEVNA